MVVYLLTATLLWAVSLALYEVQFRKLPLHRENRAYLLLSLCLGMLLPLANVRINTAGATEILREPVQRTTALRREIDRQAGEVQRSGDPAYWLQVVYLAGAVIAFLLLLRQAIFLYRVYRQGRREAQGGYTIVYSASIGTPFSFFRTVFIPQQVVYTSAELNMILRHERQHGRLLHSLDVIVLLLLRCLLWFNPLIYLYWHRLRLIHEFQADSVEMENAPAYGHFLLEQAMLSKPPLFTHSILYSPLKIRIAMLLKTNTATRLRYATAILLLPAFFICCAYAAPKGERTKKGNKIYFNDNVIELGGGDKDTVKMLDPKSGEWNVTIFTRDSFPVKLNGQTIIQDVVSQPKFAGEENNGAAYLFGRLKPLLDKLEDGTYTIRLDHVVLGANGRVAYYEMSGIAPVPSQKPDKGAARQATDATAQFEKSDIKQQIDAATAEVLEGGLTYKPAVIDDGRTVPTIIQGDLDLAGTREIVVKGHRAVLTARKGVFGR